MEPPSSFDRPMHAKQSSEPHVRINELPALNRARGGPPQATSNLRRANTVSQSGNLLKKNLERKATRERTAPATGPLGLRVKNSQDLLRKAAPLGRSQTHRGPLQARPPGRKVGHFTVGSVGQNGKIFLRYDR
ncbi:hypothetical protein N7468_004803 [Penicillium chermesinum]|uniref:Uncharacterized protein n=1 Tax=Penicillium chermesinum TaxID=63820 RepID=A0A9W9P904_9EURO|nr:uncharacterized protein N7468_004803 [Penicillium chermesinum]KAJ5240184.1 hypothetical protein N7468_004803 [Penicillium chermesinum]